MNYSNYKFEVELLLVREKLCKFVEPGVRPEEQPGTVAVRGKAADLAEWVDGDKRARATIGLLVELSLSSTASSKRRKLQKKLGNQSVVLTRSRNLPAKLLSMGK